MRRLPRFLSSMDAQAWRTLAISFVMFGGAGLVLLFGAQVLGLGGEAAVERWLGAVHGPWSLPAAVAAFAILAFVGTPQIVLIAAAVVVFGPVTGAAYSWIGTMISSLVGYYLGRAAGARALDRFSSEGLRRFAERIGRNGFLASLIVRLVPSAPFIVVNMMAGVTPMQVTHFAAGTALGIIPKIVLVAFAGAAVARIMRGEIGGETLLLAAVAVAWLAVGWVVKVRLNARERDGA